MYVSIPTVESWPTPNYINPQTRGDSVLIIHSTLYSLVVIVVGLRIYTRIWISRSFGLDDVFILIAMVLQQSTLLETLHTKILSVTNNNPCGPNAACPVEIRLEPTCLGRPALHCCHRRKVFALKSNLVCHGKHLYSALHALPNSENPSKRIRKTSEHHSLCHSVDEYRLFGFCYCCDFSMQVWISSLVS